MRPALKRGLLASSALALAAVAAWVAAPFCVDDPIPGVYARTPARTWCDRNGIELYCERTWQYEWRFDIPLGEIPADVVAVMLAVEDARFFQHGGIDYRSVCRAVLQNLAAGRVVSGASTISMQTAAMDYHSGRRNLLQKILQSAKTRRMERLHTKEEILEAYFNNLPFGGNIYGIEAASRFYFGKHARDLGVAEASILCGLPQLPNRLRPDRHPEAARRRQGIVLDRLVRAGLLTEAEADALRKARPRYRDFSQPASFERIGSPREWGFVIGTTPGMRHGDPQTVRLPIDAELNRRVTAALARRAAAAHGVADAACTVIDIASGDEIVHVGTLDFDSPAGGQIDAARSIRSSGSALKPFIYEEAIRGGLLVAETVMTDAPVRFGSYRPTNHGGGFSGRVSAAFALSHSLNTPAVRLLAALGEERVARRFAELGLATHGQVTTNGLSLALGTAGYRLADITRAYASIAPRTTADDGGSGAAQKAATSCAMLAEMLRTLPLPGTDLPVAWKTGTSNGSRDAWAFAYTPDFAIGVWFGNKDGSRSDALLGYGIAAPAAGEIAEMLYEHRAPPVWPFPPSYSETAELCAETGLRASPSCAATFQGRVLRDIPLALCESCARPAQRTSIVSPAPGAYRLADGHDSIDLPLNAAGAAVSWFVDGRLLPSGTSSFKFKKGLHAVAAVPDDPAAPTARITLSVSDE